MSITIVLSQQEVDIVKGILKDKVQNIEMNGCIWENPEIQQNIKKRTSTINNIIKKL